MRDDRHVVRLGHRRNPARGRIAAAPLHLRLDDVRGVIVNDVVKRLGMIFEVAGRQQNRGNAVAQNAVAFRGPAVLQRVFKPFHVIIADPFGDARGKFNVP